MKSRTGMRWLFLLVVVLATSSLHGADYVIAVSVDGLGSTYLQSMVDAGKLPHFARIEAEGACTTNARADCGMTVTLPNHTTMVTSRPILGAAGHTWTNNTDPAKGTTLHTKRGAYVASVFDVAHDNGLRTGMWATKTKFSLFDVSYDKAHGAPDCTGPDNGRRKLDRFVYMKDSPLLTDDFIAAMSTQACQFAFVHFAECDSTGHSIGWGTLEYNAALVMIDGCLGRIMDLMTSNAALKGRTTLIVTADHGGKGKKHDDPLLPIDYTIPFLAWGAGVKAGNLYAWNADTRQDPGGSRIEYAAPLQPVHNGDVGNLALDLLGLGPIPGATINARQDLRLAPAADTALRGPQPAAKHSL
jgi:hypothetical protein